MKYTQNGVEGVKIAYVGGGSRGWAWGLMSDLVSTADISGEVRLFDIDKQAAEHNVIIGEKFNAAPGARSHWSYHAFDTLGEALDGADFVVISILPGTFDEMESDVHTPEKYGIYQSVGDTSGPGGIVRALRAIPMFEEIAAGIRDHCPKAWVINYTNPMTVLVRTLYRVFPEIKAFGCCHEVFGTQKLLATMVTDKYGIENIPRDEIKVTVTGVNHFTWLTSAKYRNMDLMPLYAEYAKRYAETGFARIGSHDDNWMNNVFACNHRVKFDLFNRYGAIAAAGDRHLAEFCPGKWYLSSPEAVVEWHFGLTPVSWRKEDLGKRLRKSARRLSGEEAVTLRPTGEDGVNQIRALLGLNTMVTNVNLPNVGQVPNLPMGAVVETNAVFTSDSVIPVMTGALPQTIYPLIARIVGEQEMVVEAALTRNIELAFNAFVNDPLVTVGGEQARELFDKMLKNTQTYLKMYAI
ncbi:MAG: alpha-glucosidase/alpha-galactosidase [Ruminococcaceae bacterium]|nr:alpha-glucosidase/alpha-galactosidase [Oscillospiraceae bacterium]